MKLLATIAFLAATELGCAAPDRPYVTTRVVGDFRPGWFYDGPEMVVDAVNPTGEPVHLVVLCGGAGPWPVLVPAHDHVAVLGRVNNRDAAFSPCRLEE